MNYWLHWCPKGCGKQVYYAKGWKAIKPYICRKCNKEYTKKEIEDY